MGSKPLRKTTIIIWTDPEIIPETSIVQYSLEDLAREAISGSAYCSSSIDEIIEEPSKDPSWDATEFFEDV